MSPCFANPPGSIVWLQCRDTVRDLVRPLSPARIPTIPSERMLATVFTASSCRELPRSLTFIFSLPPWGFPIIPLCIMAKPLTKSQITTSLAETVGVTKKQATEALEALAALAYKNAKNKFTIPGLGKLVLVNRKARMGRNPATGETIKIAAKRVVKFRVAKAAKDAILGTK
jgi:DNA-binding protein HU-beta